MENTCLKLARTTLGSTTGAGAFLDRRFDAYAVLPTCLMRQLSKTKTLPEKANTFNMKNN